jgi:hypothetical protein
MLHSAYGCGGEVYRFHCRGRLEAEPLAMTAGAATIPIDRSVVHFNDWA